MFALNLTNVTHCRLCTIQNLVRSISSLIPKTSPTSSSRSTTGLSISSPTTSSCSPVTKLEGCVMEVKRWCTARRLYYDCVAKLKRSGNSDAVLLSVTLASQDCTLTIGEKTVNTTDVTLVLTLNCRWNKKTARRQDCIHPFLTHPSPAPDTSTRRTILLATKM